MGNQNGDPDEKNKILFSLGLLRMFHSVRDLQQLYLHEHPTAHGYDSEN